MMQIIYFSEKQQFLREIETREGLKEYVTPSPAKADGLRLRLSGQNSQDVITIAKFTSNLVNHLWKSEEKPQVKRKSELLLIFGILKNQYLPELGHEQFTQAYNLFSDLRSFTLNEETLTSVLDEQPEIIRQSVQLFWKILDLTGNLDEHGAYQHIAEKLRSSEEIEELKKSYIFWGFQHLNGQQVDLLKALAIRYDVIIPFPLSLKENLKRSDWISWLKDSKVQEIDLPVKNNLPKAKLIHINSREISLSLKGFLKAGDQIILGVSKLSPLHLDIIPSSEISYKIPHQLLATELKEIASELKQFQGTFSELTQWLKDLSLKFSGLKYLRAIELFKEAVVSVNELTDNEIKFDHFFLKLLSEVVALNQPRTSFVPVSPLPLTMALKDMSSLEEIDRSQRVILCFDDRFDDIQGLGQNYTESIQKALSVLGPLKRNELELLFRQWEFHDLFSHADVTVFMGEQTLKHSLIWKRLFTGINLEPSPSNHVTEARLVIDPLSNIRKIPFAGSFSASKLQTFLDCPRKFYFNYVDKVFPQIELEKDFDPMISGTIIHEIIEKFFKGNLLEEDLGRLTTEVMQVYISKKNLELPKEVYLKRHLIFSHRALNGIQFIRQVEGTVNEKITWKIEEDFNLEKDFKMKGRIDCIGISQNYLFLLDFKSTSSSASSNTEVSSFESIQLWAYALASRELIPNALTKTVVLGYVVLDDSTESSLLTADEDYVKTLKENKFCSVHQFKETFADKINEADELLKNIALTIESEDQFLPKPRKAVTCLFCDLNKVCVKGEISHV